MNVEIKGKTVVVTFPIEKPKASASGKNLVVFSTRGNRPTNVEIDGKPLTIGLTAYIPAKD